MRRSFMEAPALRREIERRRRLSQLRTRLTNTTTLIPSAGSSSGGTVSAQTWINKSVTLATPSIPTGEPILQVKCPFGETQCVETMATYHQACCKFYQLSASISTVLAAQPLPDLQRVFCPGRLLFIRLPGHPSSLHRSLTTPDWLVPAMVVDVNKVAVQGVTEVQWNLITWDLPPSPIECTPPKILQPSTESDSMDEETEEEVLQEGEDRWLAPTPFPPQLMPVFNPSSSEDSLSRLTLLTNQTSRCLIRICDECLQLNSKRLTINSSVALTELLTRAITRHRQERAALQAGFRLMTRSGTATADEELPQIVDEVSRSLYWLARQTIDMTSRTDNKTDRDIAVQVFGLPAVFPPPLQLGRVLRAKTNADESSNEFFNELWLLTDELTTPLLGSSLTQRLAPMTCPDLRAHLAQFHRTCRRRWAVKRLETSLSNDKLSLNTEYLGRLRVLEELGFIDTANERGCLSLKGLVACELQQMEVLLTQLLLDGSFTQLPATDIAALMSCFVFELRSSDLTHKEQQAAHMVSASAKVEPHVMSIVPESVETEKNPGTVDQTEKNCALSHLSSKQKKSVPDHLREHVEKIYQFSSALEELQRKHGLSDPVADTQLNCSLVRVTHAWASGHPFATVIQLTDMQEGNLIRGLLRLDELLRHVCNACHRLGDQALGLRMNEARNAIHRDLVCAPSLYISEEFVYKPTDTGDEVE